MRVLLVTLHDLLMPALTEVLNPDNDYCAIVVDEVESSEKFAESVGLSKKLIHPMYELKECISDFYYDFVVLFSDVRIVWSDLQKTMYDYGLPYNKLVHFCLANNWDNHMLVERAMRYYKEHSDQFEMIATGICHTQNTLDYTQFKHRLFNFGRGSQDLYYDYKLAKFAITNGGGDGLFMH